MRGQTQANGQRQLAGETVRGAIDAQLPPGRHVIPRFCFAAKEAPRRVRPAAVLATLPTCGSATRSPHLRHTFAWLMPDWRERVGLLRPAWREFLM